MARPRVLFVSRTRYTLPLSPTLERKWDALAAVLDLRVLATSTGGPQRNETFVLSKPLAGASFWFMLPFRVVRELRRFRPGVVVTQSPYEAAAALAARRLAGIPARVILEVHGDWRTATRLYGSPLRSVLAPLADTVAAGALRRVDAVRTVSPYTTALVRELGLEPRDAFPAYMDLDPFLETDPVPPPEEPTALFVGVLEPYKNVDGLAAAWRLVARRLPGARLHVVGKGSREDVVRELVRDCPESVRWTRRLDSAGVAVALDAATLLVLPSRSEGMGRVVIEAFSRARPVVGTRVGGIPDLVDDGVTGVLVEPGSTDALASALEGLLRQRDRARELGEAAHARVRGLLQTPEEYAGRTRALVDDLRP
jgi:glycosyltransferase involved in cell wall biosynthesis